jgi:hypothetical protein
MKKLSAINHGKKSVVDNIVPLCSFCPTVLANFASKQSFLTKSLKFFLSCMSFQNCFSTSFDFIPNQQKIPNDLKGAGKKGGLSENQDIGNGYIRNQCISDTFDDVISDMSISDISIAKNGHIGLDISEI